MYFISFFTPRRNTLWLFGSHNNSFSDNSKYFFYHVADNCPEIDVVWVGGNKVVLDGLRAKGYRAVNRWSIKGVWVCLTGGVYVFSSYSSDINYWASGGALKFNLWHGIPLKRIQFDVNVGKLGKVYNSYLSVIYSLARPEFYQKPDYFLSTSPLITSIFSRSFRIDEKRCMELGYPRCDHFFWKKDKIYELIKVKHPEMLLLADKFREYKRTIMYMPTFREHGSNKLDDVLDVGSLGKWLKSNDYLMVVKQHPNVPDGISGDHQNILFIDSLIDVYLVLPFTDILITDYSSVFFDYMHLNKPMIFYAYDLEDYEAKERGFYFDVKALGVGKIIHESSELVSAMKFDEEVLECPQYTSFWGDYKKGESCKELQNRISEIVSKRG
jgi:CDP-glycerol glycerophosphotransferase (TagB/SpsB family)